MWYMDSLASNLQDEMWYMVNVQGDMWYTDSVALNIQDDVEGGQQWLLMYKLIFIIPLILIFAINMVSPSLTITCLFTHLTLPTSSRV